MLHAELKKGSGGPRPAIRGAAADDAESEELEAAAATAASSGDHVDAAAKYRSALELNPTSTVATDGLFAALGALYGPPGKGPQADRNRTADFASTTRAAVARGDAQEVSADPPVYLLHDIVSTDEAAALLAAREARRAPWIAVPPVVCFDHAAFQSHAALQPYFIHGLGNDRKRSCLNRTASAAAASVISYSESLSLFKGEEALVDEVGRRLQERAGLDPMSGINFQLLSYELGAAYHEHTDCVDDQDPVLHARGPTRMASVLLYLTDGFEARPSSRRSASS